MKRDFGVFFEQLIEVENESMQYSSNESIISHIQQILSLKLCVKQLICPQKRKKYQRKRDLREVKKMLKPFEKIQVDIKYLDDIPEFYTAYRVFRLPKYQITARCVRTGALFYAYAMEKTSTNTTMFLLRLGEHLKAHGVELNTVIIQTDNGTEFASTMKPIILP